MYFLHQRPPDWRLNLATAAVDVLDTEHEPVLGHGVCVALDIQNDDDHVDDFEE